MKKFSLILAVVFLMSGGLMSCNGDSKKADTKKEKKGEPHGEHAQKHNKDKGNLIQRADKKGPQKEGHKGGPKGLPEQTKTLEEIGGYKIGETATDFKLKNVDGSIFSLASIENAKGYVVTFTCNGCPFSKMYEDRLIALHKQYAPKGYAVVAINPNFNQDSENENFLAMQKRAKEKAFPFVYLADDGQKIFPQYGAVRTPHVFLLDAERTVQYIGTIDDNAKHAEDVKVTYLEDAINALEKGEKPNPNFTKAIGCPVKMAKK